jgi:uncharacterized membrane protein HdeD (DUF308 family)
MSHQFCKGSGSTGTGSPLAFTTSKKGMVVMLKSLSTSLILRGLLAVAIGVVALAWPGVTVLALVVVFAVYAFIGAGLQAMQAFSSRTAGPVFGHLLVGLLDIAAGVLALAWPGVTALVLVLLVASWAVVTGALEVFAAFQRDEEAGTRAMYVFGGLVSMAFGTVLFARPGMGAISLALLFGLFNLIGGSWLFVRGIELRQARTQLHSLVSPSKTKSAA